MQILRSIYYANFELPLSYASLVWAQNESSVIKPHILQKKSLRMFFQNRNVHIGPLFKISKVLKFSGKVALENCALISNKSLHKTLTKILSDLVTQSFEFRIYNTRCVNSGYINVPFDQTKSYVRLLLKMQYIFGILGNLILSFKNKAIERFGY